MNILIVALSLFLSRPHFLEQNTIVIVTNSKADDICIQDKKRKKTLFEQHFKILDSIVNAYPNDTVYTGDILRSLSFMVKNTNIEVTTDISGIVGRIKFNKSDWLNWHKWYRKKYGIKK